MSTIPIILTPIMPADNSTLTHTHSHTETTGASASTLPLIPSPTSLRELSHLFLDSCFSPLPEAEGELSDQDRNRLCDTLAHLREASNQAQQAYLAVHASIQQYQQLVLSTHAQVAAAKHTLMQARGVVVASPSASFSSPPTSASTSSTSLVSTVSSSNASTPPLSPVSPISPNGRLLHHAFPTPKDVHDPATGHAHLCTSQNYPHHPHPHQQEQQHHAKDASDRGTGGFLKESTEKEQQPQQLQEAEQDPEAKEMQLAKLKQQHAELGGRLSQLLRDKAAAEETKKRLNDGLLRTKARMKEIERRLGK